MTLGEAIKTRRNQLGLSQDEVGKRIGSNDSRVSRMERTSNGQIQTLIAIAEVLECDVVDILVSAGFGKSQKTDHLDILCESEVKYLTEEDRKYIKTFIDALIEQRKREWSDGI